MGAAAGTRVLSVVKKRPLTNPRRRGIVFGTEVYQVRYRHKEDGKLYKHDFETGAELVALEDGSILIRSTEGKRLWLDDDG